jgi:hypothetical protein
MADRWIVQVHDKEYGPVDFQTLLEWKEEGRVLPENPVRATDCDSWTTAAEIPGLFIVDAAAAPASLSRSTAGMVPVATTADGSDATDQPQPGATPWQSTSAATTAAATSPRSFFGILSEAIRIFGRSLVQFICLAIFTMFPSLAAQLASAWVQSTPVSAVDIRTVVAGAFAFCMLIISIVLWPIYIAAIQIISAEMLAGRRIGFFVALNEAVKFWPRIAALCAFVYGIFFLLIIFAIAIALMLVAGSTSPIIIFFALALLVLQVWMFGRFFINVLFWPQFAVLENAGVFESLRASKQLARSGRDRPWYKRPWWRGAVIVSIWIAFVLAIALCSDWPTLTEQWNAALTIHDPQLLVQKIAAIDQARGFNVLGFSLAVVQKLLQPLLGIAFVVLYFDSKSP